MNIESSPLEQPEGQESKKSGWVDETELRSESVDQFVRGTWQGIVDGTAGKRYDSITEFHFSGYGGIGDRAIGGVATLYDEDGTTTQIHAFYGNVQEKGVVDVYLQGQALEDYLRGENSATDDDESSAI